MQDQRVSLCQACPTDHFWTYADWLLTMRPGVFGLVPGCANLTGVLLILVLTTIFIGALRFVRRSGHFEVIK